MKNKTNKKTTMLGDEVNDISKMPLVSVVMPCYNNGAYVAQAIESVQNQTYDNWELVIVNDGSTDNSDEVINQYIQKNKRIRYFKQENSGASVARNNGVKAATGEYICFLDADDWLASECLQNAMDIFYTYSDCREYCLKRMDVDESTHQENEFIAYPGSFRNVLVYGMSITIIIRRDDFLRVGGFDENMRSGFEDWEFNVRFLDKNSIVIVSDTPLYFYRCYNNGKRVSDKAEQNKVWVQSYIYKKNMEKYVECLGSPIITYQYEDRSLPCLCRKILNMKAILYNFVNKVTGKR